jgi:hypothetical protein
MLLAELFRRGILDDKIFTAAGDDITAIVRKFSEIALKPHQATELGDEGAWTAIAAQDALDDASE